MRYNFNYKKQPVHSMSARKKRIFDLNVKIGATMITLPVYEKQSDISLIERIMEKYPSLNNFQCIDKIKNKIFQSLKSIQRSSNISHKLKGKIKQFLDRSEIQINISGIGQQYINEGNSRKSSLVKQNKRVKKSEQNKQNKTKSESKNKNQQFTKIYQITKSIFKQSKEQNKQQFKNVAKIIFKGNSCLKKETKQKLNESEILERIQNKLQNYQKKFHYSNHNEFKSSKEEFSMTAITEPFNEQVFQSAQLSLQSKKRKFSYNHDQLINDRKLTERKIEAQYRSRSKEPAQDQNDTNKERSAEKNIIFHSNPIEMGLSRSYQIENYSGLRKNYYKINEEGSLDYFQSNTRASLPKFNYLNAEQLNSSQNLKISNKTLQCDSFKKVNSSRPICQDSSRKSSLDKGEVRERKFRYL